MGFDFIMDVPLQKINNKNSNNEKSAIILVGSTGTGKSSTISKCTGHAVKVGDGHQAVTRCCDVY